MSSNQNIKTLVEQVYLFIAYDRATLRESDSVREAKRARFQLLTVINIDRCYKILTVAILTVLAHRPFSILIQVER